MNTFQFGVGTGRVKPNVMLAAHTIAKRHDARFVVASMPEGPRFWFSAQNLGFPFNRATAEAVKADLLKAGIADETAYIAKKHFR